MNQVGKILAGEVEVTTQTISVEVYRWRGTEYTSRSEVQLAMLNALVDGFHFEGIHSTTIAIELLDRLDRLKEIANVTDDG